MMRARTKSIIFKICELSVLLTPMCVLIGLRSKLWFSHNDKIHISIGFVLCMIVVFVMLMGYAKKIKAPIWSLIFLLITYELKSIITDAYMILFCSTIGLTLSIPFNRLYERYKHIADIVRDEYYKTYARTEALKEIERKGE